ncbi:MAG: xanthine dehydrogenase family protein molybdopterin-binding subunit, partial [Chloroflexi bacterium]|nr:xanthine dehydrogenase family protein molybdopterin-binding subunit [Chloroflexota bacterium]
GAAEYTGDVELRGMAYMAVLRSPHAHARIRGIDPSKALELRDVLAVLTGAEIQQHCQSQFLLFALKDGVRTKSRWPMAVDVAKYVGEPVAVVLATSITAAEDALELIDVDYDPLPAVVDVEAAAEDGSPLVHEELGTNLSVEASGTAGDPDQAFGQADGVVSARLVEPRLIPNPMESRAVVASYERGTGNMTMWLSTQTPHLERNFVAQVLGFPENKLRVLSRDVGGGFGCKIDTYPETLIAAILAMRSGRPVKWVEDRQEHFTCTIHGRGEVQYIDAAYSNDGILLGMRLRYYTDLGAYSNGGTHAVAETSTPSGAQGIYRVRNLAWTTYGVFTNKVPVGPYRGYGQHATAYLIERVMDLIARELSMDPVEVRRKNMIPADALPYRTPMGREYDSGDYKAALDKVLELAGYQQLREEQKRLRDQGTLMGIGVATNVDRSGFGPPSVLSARQGYESAIVRVESTGKVTAITGSSPHGQGHETVFSQIICDKLGVPMEDVEVLYGDTAVVPQGVGTRASRSLVVGGSAFVEASQIVREKATQIAAGLLRVDPQHVTLQGGRFCVEDIPDSYVTWADVAREAYGPGALPGELTKGLEATVYWQPQDYTYPYSANVATVLVDKDTGHVQLRDYFYVDDCGTVINPMIVEGQIHGGLAQGIGAALLEQGVFDSNGQLVSGSFMDYAMPKAHQLPDFTLEGMQTPSPHNPLGAKGMGESPTVAAVPAIVNAVVDALSHLGVIHVDIPLTPEKVWRAMQDAQDSFYNEG